MACGREPSVGNVFSEKASDRLLRRRGAWPAQRFPAVGLPDFFDRVFAAVDTGFSECLRHDRAGAFLLRTPAKARGAIACGQVPTPLNEDFHSEANEPIVDRVGLSASTGFLARFAGCVTYKNLSARLKFRRQLAAP